MRAIIVGRDPPAQFFLHHNVSRKSSRLFQTIPSSTEDIKLPHSDPQALNLYSSWLYTDRLPLTPQDPRTGLLPWSILAPAYVLGVDIEDASFVGLIVDYIRAASRPSSTGVKTFYMSDSPTVITTIYNGTKSGSSARLLMVQLYAVSNTSRWLDGRMGQFPCEFLFDLALVLARVKEGHPARDVSEERCAYHSHAIDVEDRRCVYDRA
jgi:hypothetical protein